MANYLPSLDLVRNLSLTDTAMETIFCAKTTNSYKARPKETAAGKKVSEIRSESRSDYRCYGCGGVWLFEGLHKAKAKGGIYEQIGQL